MRRAPLAAAALALALLLPLAPAASQEPADAAVLAAFRGLLGDGERRAFFALPKAAYWRATGPVTVVLDSPDPDVHRPALAAAAAAFAGASGLDIRLRPAGVEEGASLLVRVGPVDALAERAAELGAHPGVVQRFAEAKWPFAFAIERAGGRAVSLFVNRRTRPEAVQASFVLALVWALGGATLGGGLDGLVEPHAGRPRLTPLGEKVIALMYHPRLESGLPLVEAQARARAVLAAQ